MPASLGSYQSLVQLAAGANLAIFALPRLGVVEYETELRRWTAISRLADRQDAQAALNAASVTFAVETDFWMIERWNRWARLAALVTSLGATGCLAWMSERPDDAVSAPVYIVLALNSCPAIWLVGNNLWARYVLHSSRVLRKNAG